MSKIKCLRLIKIEIIKIEIKVKIIVFHFINYLLKTNKMINIENKNKKIRIKKDRKKKKEMHKIMCCE